VVRGVGTQILPALSGHEAQRHPHRILGIPGHMNNAFACRFGHPSAAPVSYLRVRRELGNFVRGDRYTEREHR